MLVNFENVQEETVQEENIQEEIAQEETVQEETVQDETAKDKIEAAAPELRADYWANKYKLAGYALAVLNGAARYPGKDAKKSQAEAEKVLKAFANEVAADILVQDAKKDTDAALAYHAGHNLADGRPATALVADLENACAHLDAVTRNINNRWESADTFDAKIAAAEKALADLQRAKAAFLENDAKLTRDRAEAIAAVKKCAAGYGIAAGDICAALVK